MDKILETIMNFINENTTLLIIICVFLIFVLIGYLIDNSIKTKRLERQMSEEVPSSPEPEVIDTPIEEKKEEVKEEIIEEPKVEEPVVEEITAPKEDEVPTVEPVVEETKEEEPKVEIPVENIEEEKAPLDTEEISNEVTVDPKVNDMLLRDFSTNGVSSIDTEDTEVSLNPINNIDNINIEEPAPIEPAAPVYKNDKKLSDIFKKKSEPAKPVENTSSPKLENTVDFSNELDRILQKLNETTGDTKDSTLDETQDFSNMF